MLNLPSCLGVYSGASKEAILIEEADENEDQQHDKELNGDYLHVHSILENKYITN
jgi:hypothetical protein